MKEQLKDDLKATALLSPFAIGASAVYYWVFEWAWWISIPAGLASAYLIGVFLVALPFIIWGIVGD